MGLAPKVQVHHKKVPSGGIFLLVPEMGLEPIWISPFDFKSNAYTNSAIRALFYYIIFYLFKKLIAELAETAPSAAAVTNCRRFFALQSPAAKIPSWLVSQFSLVSI